MRPLRLVLLPLCFCVGIGAHSLSAEQPAVPQAQAPATFSLPSGPQAMAVLQGQWRFHPGDNPHWADPQFDDSSWTLLPSDQHWPSTKYPALEGFAWYRFKVSIPANAGPIAIELPKILTSYQLFADGVQIGTPSPRPLETQALRTTRAVYRIPSQPAPHTVTFALRVWHWHVWASYYGGGPDSPTRVGAESAIIRDYDLVTESTAWQNVDVELLAILGGIAGLVALALFGLQTRERAYLWFSLALIMQAFGGGFSIWTQNHVFNVNQGDNLDLLFSVLSVICFTFFYRDFLGTKATRFFWFVIACQVLSISMSYAGIADYVPVSVILLLITILLIPYYIWVLALLIRSARQHVAEARLLLGPVLLLTILQIAASVVWGTFTAGWQTRFSQQDITLANWPFAFSLGDVAQLLFLFAMVAILMVRFSRLAREQDRIHADLAAARTLQQMLIPEKHPETPGWSITTAYHPAQEVGGDFFQIIQVPSLTGPAAPDTIVLLGDAAGKGLPAAMTVSMLLGAFRTITETSSSPATILSGLNRRLSARGEGFTTAVALRLTASGQLTLASAGHLSPYLNGEELPVAAALPLGMDPELALSESRYDLQPGDRVTLMTDGVPEARHHHELFGFERTKDLSNHSAQAIAAAAINFGQEDDVTVMSLVAT